MHHSCYPLLRSLHLPFLSPLFLPLSSQCRAALVQGGALRLLRCWLELGTDVMVGIREALAQAQGSGLAQGPGLGHGEDSMNGLTDNGTGTWTPASLQRALGPEAFRLSEYTQALDLLTNASAALM